MQLTNAVTHHAPDDRPSVAIAVCGEHRIDDEGHLLLDALREAGVDARPVIWTDEPDGGWAAFDLVVIRATWDYTFMLARFLDWTRAVGAGRLLNPPDVIAW